MSLIALSYDDVKRLQAGGSRPKNLVSNDDLAALVKQPLPKPPHDSMWVKDEESGDYSVVKKPDTPGDSEQGMAMDGKQVITPAEEVPEFIYHVVMPEDTLVGICMRYRVNKRLLQRHNAFVDDFSFRCCEKIKIPTAALKDGVHVQSNDEEAVKLQRMKNATKLPTIEAKLYLDDHGWNVDAAIVAFQADNAWEEAVSAPPMATREMVPMRSGKTQTYEPPSPSSPTSAADEAADEAAAAAGAAGSNVRAGFHPVYSGVPVAGAPPQGQGARAASPPAAETDTAAAGGEGGEGGEGAKKPPARRSSWGLF
mmetsp:Transcript_22694/g.59237  ORF Transcript_22694/g.59237 Transcript_22694/m.59237 type:complete len:311 (-) Transcript_22694:25-957(-)